MVGFDDIARRLDVLTAAVERIERRLDDMTSDASSSVSEWTTPKGAARDLHVSPDTVLRRARAIGCVQEIGHLILVDVVALRADLVAHPLQRRPHRTRDTAHDRSRLDVVVSADGE
jgi:hypothetical protein